MYGISNGRLIQKITGLEKFKKLDKINDYSPENNNKQIMKIDCNKQCDFCPATICEERGRQKYVDGEATNKINEKNIQNNYADVTAKFIRK